MSCQTKFDDRRMDKLVHDDKGNTTISATIMKLLEYRPSRCKILMGILISQDSEVGDGTTTVVLLAGGFFSRKLSISLRTEDILRVLHSYQTSLNLAINKVKELSVSIEGKILEEKKSLLVKRAATTLSSKLIGGEREIFLHSRLLSLLLQLAMMMT